MPLGVTLATLLKAAWTLVLSELLQTNNVVIYIRVKTWRIGLKLDVCTPI
jgi:hypothetical protein